MDIRELTNTTFPEGFGESGLERSDVLHLTDVIADVDRMLNVSGHGEGGGFTCRRSTFEMGFTWEEALSVAFANRMRKATESKKQEVVRDGIAMSVDGWREDVKTLFEFKLTWTSHDKLDAAGLERHWRYMTQLKAYARAVKAQRVEIWVMHVVGDWKFDKWKGPMFRRFRIKFEEEELDSNWRMLTQHAREHGKEILRRVRAGNGKAKGGNVR